VSLYSSKLHVFIRKESFWASQREIEESVLEHRRKTLIWKVNTMIECTGMQRNMNEIIS
jgi:hypothetical protein